MGDLLSPQRGLLALLKAYCAAIYIQQWQAWRTLLKAYCVLVMYM